MKKKMYLSINIIISTLAFVFLFQMFWSNRVIYTFIKGIHWFYFVLGAIFMAFVFIIKFLRIYLILLEQRIPLKRFIKIYIKMAFIMLAIPFKTGELFKMYNYSYEVKNFKIGTLSVLVERYFDTCALFIILISLEGIVFKRISLLSILLVTFILVLTIIYFTFNSTHKYLSKYLLLNVESQRGVIALKLLSECKEWYRYTTKLLNGRSMLILLLSCIAWIIEYVEIIFIAKAYRVDFNIYNFTEYLKSILIGNGNEQFAIYGFISTLLLAVCAIVLYSVIYFKKGSETI